jgi:polypeptide N-acetylgalactosaminyltransferase
VRERLKCKSFDWFMKEIAFDQDRFYPAVEPPDSANGKPWLNFFRKFVHIR